MAAHHGVATKASLVQDANVQGWSIKLFLGQVLQTKQRKISDERFSQDKTSRNSMLTLQPTSPHSLTFFKTKICSSSF